MFDDFDTQIQSDEQAAILDWIDENDEEINYDDEIYND